MRNTNDKIFLYWRTCAVWWHRKRVISSRRLELWVLLVSSSVSHAVACALNYIYMIAHPHVCYIAWNFFSGKYSRVRNVPMKYPMVTFRSSIETNFIHQSQECSVWRTQYHCWLCRMRLEEKIETIFCQTRPVCRWIGCQMQIMLDGIHMLLSDQCMDVPGWTKK